MRTLLIFTLFSLWAIPKVKAQPAVSKKVDSFIHGKMVQYQIPGIAVAIIKNNVVIKKSIFGFSNLDNKTPVSNHTVFPIASIDKQITASCIMMLYEKGKIKLTDSINSFIDSVPETWNKIQVRHLLSHTSGLPDNVAESYQGRNLINYTTAEILDFIKKQPLEFKPGERFIYSDAGFVLLQLIVEKISGMSYGDFLDKNVLQPLGMQRTQTLNPTQIVQQRATSYYKNRAGKILVNTWRQIDFGPLYNDIGTTIDDFIKYDIAINTQRLLSKETYEMMWSPFVLNSGRTSSNIIDEQNLFYANASYGYGWGIEKYNEHRIIYHGGFTGTSIMKFPGDNLTVILFSNLTDQSGFNPDVMARHIASFYIPVSSFNYSNKATDPDLPTTLFVKSQISKLSAGIVDNEAFTNTFLPVLNPAISAFKERAQLLGAFESLQYLDSKKDVKQKQTITFYKANYKNGVLYFEVSVTEDGKIDFITVER